MEEINRSPSIIRRPPIVRRPPTLVFPPPKEPTRPIRLSRSARRELERHRSLRDLTVEERKEVGRQIRESKGFDVTIPEGARPCADDYFDIDLTMKDLFKKELQFSVEEVKNRKGRSLKLVKVLKIVMYGHHILNFTLKMRDGKLEKNYRAQVCNISPDEMAFTYFEDITPGVVDPSIEGSPYPNSSDLFAREAGSSSEKSVEAGPSSEIKEENNSKKQKREESVKEKAKAK